MPGVMVWWRRKVCDEDAQAYSFEVPYYIGIRLYPPEWEDGLAKTWIPFPYIIPNRNYKGNIVMRHEVIPKIIEKEVEAMKTIMKIWMAGMLACGGVLAAPAQGEKVDSVMVYGYVSAVNPRVPVDVA